MAEKDFKAANRKVNSRLVSIIRTYWAKRSNEYNRPAIIVDPVTTYIKSDMIDGEPKRR